MEVPSPPIELSTLFKRLLGNHASARLCFDVHCRNWIVVVEQWRSLPADLIQTFSDSGFPLQLRFPNQLSLPHAMLPPVAAVPSAEMLADFRQFCDHLAAHGGSNVSGASIAYPFRGGRWLTASLGFTVFVRWKGLIPEGDKPLSPMFKSYSVDVVEGRYSPSFYGDDKPNNILFPGRVISSDEPGF